MTPTGSIGAGVSLLSRRLGPRLACTRCHVRSNSSLAGPSSQKPYYVTTPIFYVNASPHLGHLHSLVLADVLARFRRFRQPERTVLFATGTDEHGLKIQKAAEAGGTSEQQFCDDVSQRFRNLSAQADISHTTFIRTSEERHTAAVEHFWSRLVDSGDIYKATHSGWYSVSDETFYGTSQVEEREGKMVSVETDNEVVWTEEENWKFRLSAYRDRVRAWASDPRSVQPETYRNAVLQEVSGMEDLSVSRPRSRVRWGVPVPNDPDQTIYVWVDALINYLTVLGYPNSLSGWPADAHIVGKDIVKFHAVHWPALLMSAGLEPPRTVLTHAHWTMSRAKMSKSKGNVVDPVVSMQKWGVDGVRWYLMRVGGSLPLDSDYSEEALASHYRQLGDMIGNLLSRSRSPKIRKRMLSTVLQEHDAELDRLMAGLRDTVTDHMDNYRITKACEAVMDLMAAANKQFARLAPWKAADSTTAITYAHHCLRLAGTVLQPVMPSKAAELLDALSITQEQRTWEGAVWPPLGIDPGAIPAPPTTIPSVERTQARDQGVKQAGGTLFPPVEL